MTYSKQKEEQTLNILKESDTLQSKGYPEKLALLLALGESLGTESPIPNDPHYNPNALCLAALKWNLSPFQAVEAYIDFLVAQGKKTGQRTDFNSASLEKMAYQISALMVLQKPPSTHPPKLFRRNQRIGPHWSPEEILLSRCPNPLHTILQTTLTLPNPTSQSIPDLYTNLTPTNPLPSINTLLKKIKTSPLQTIKTLSQKLEESPLWQIQKTFKQILSQGSPEIAYASAFTFLHSRKPLQYHTGLLTRTYFNPSSKVLNLELEIPPEDTPYICSRNNTPRKSKTLHLSTSNPELTKLLLLSQGKTITLQTLDIRIKKTGKWKCLAMELLPEKVEPFLPQETKALKCAKLWESIQSTGRTINWDEIVPLLDPFTLKVMTSSRSALNPKEAQSLQKAILHHQSTIPHYAPHPNP